jgi:hypothetical protein
VGETLAGTVGQLGQDAVIHQEAIQRLIQIWQSFSDLTVEFLQQRDCNLIADLELEDRPQKRIEDGLRAQRIVVMIKLTDSEEIGDAPFQCRQLVGAVVGGPSREFAYREVALEIVFVDEAKLVRFAQGDRLRRPVSRVNCPVEAARELGLELSEQLLPSLSQRIVCRKVEVLHVEAAGPIGHLEEMVLGFRESFVERGRDSAQQAILAAVCEGPTGRRRLGIARVTATVEWKNIAADGLGHG